jgi:hypothetical protein
MMTLGDAILDIDIWRAANLLIEQHGKDAEWIAIQRVEEMNHQNDLGGSITWGRIRLAVAELQAKRSRPLH